MRIHWDKTLNENAFDNITEISSYWIGFLLADGCVTKRGQFIVNLAEYDINHLIKLQNFIGSNHKIGSQHKTNSVSLSLSSVKLVAKLNEYGIIPKKSLVAKVNEQFLYDRNFWRGMIDGDGCIHISKIISGSSVGIAGTENIVTNFKNFCNQYITTNQNIHKRNEYTFIFTLTGGKAKKILQVLYEHSEIYLERKYQLYKKFNTINFYTGKISSEEVFNFILYQEERVNDRAISDYFGVRSCYTTLTRLCNKNKLIKIDNMYEVKNEICSLSSN